LINSGLDLIAAGARSRARLGDVECRAPQDIVVSENLSWWRRGI